MPDSRTRLGIPLGQMDVLPGEIKQRHLVPQPVRKGDLYFGLYGGNFSSIAIGDTGDVLMVINGLPSWQDFPQTGLAASRPTSGRFAGDQYLATDTLAFSVWTGVAWKSTTLS